MQTFETTNERKGRASQYLKTIRTIVRHRKIKIKSTVISTRMASKDYLYTVEAAKGQG